MPWGDPASLFPSPSLRIRASLMSKILCPYGFPKFPGVLEILPDEASPTSLPFFLFYPSDDFKTLPVISCPHELIFFVLPLLFHFSPSPSKTIRERLRLTDLYFSVAIPEKFPNWDSCFVFFPRKLTCDVSWKSDSPQSFLIDSCLNFSIVPSPSHSSSFPSISSSFSPTSLIRQFPFPQRNTVPYYFGDRDQC